VLDNLSSGSRENLAAFPPVPFIEGDTRDESVVSDVARGSEVIFHLAASVGNKRSIEHPIEDAEINVLGILRVIEAARRWGVTTSLEIGLPRYWERARMEAGRP
jgi:UDP-glucose 4-epimerase